MSLGEKVPRCRHCRATLYRDGVCRRHYGEASDRRGRSAEARCLRVLEEILPGCQWLISARLTHPNSPEDQSGIDLVALSDLGPLWLQIKTEGIGLPGPQERAPQRTPGVGVAREVLAL